MNDEVADVNFPCMGFFSRFSRICIRFLKYGIPSACTGHE